MINATGIGSVPHKDVKSICNFILDKFPDIPFWPQLFKVAPTENMFMQFSENLPLNTGWAGNIRWNNIAIENVERIEIVRGPSSALLGGRRCGRPL